MLRSGDLLMAINGACSTQAVGCRNGANYHGDSVLAEVTAMVRGSPRPLRLRFARAAVGLPSMIHSSLLPPNGQVCLPVLRGLIRRAAKDPNLDALGVAGHRGVVWRVLLGVFPLQTDAWPAKARELRVRGFLLLLACFVYARTHARTHSGRSVFPVCHVFLFFWLLLFILPPVFPFISVQFI